MGLSPSWLWHLLKSVWESSSLWWRWWSSSVSWLCPSRRQQLPSSEPRRPLAPLGLQVAIKRVPRDRIWEWERLVSERGQREQPAERGVSAGLRPGPQGGSRDAARGASVEGAGAAQCPRLGSAELWQGRARGAEGAEQRRPR